LLVMVVCGATLLSIKSLNTLAGQSRQQVHQELQKLLGKDATFDGLEISLSRGLGFSAKEFRIADNPRFAATPLIRAKELRLGISLTQLLLGRIVIDAVTFQDPEFQIITDEEGRLNLSEFAIEKKLPRLQAPRHERNHTAANFLIRKIRLRNGRVDFIDRSVKEPAELQVRNVEMELNGLEPLATTAFRFTAAITEGLNHDVRIEGRLGPLSKGLHWLQQPVELELQFDSLQVPLLTRALPILRNRIPRELNVAGPLALQEKVAGSFERPRITDITLKGLLFGSSDYNAVLTGEADLSKGRAWPEAQLKGKFRLDPVNVRDLRRLPFLAPLLPAALAAKGPVSIFSQFEGSWESLRVGALIKADQSELGYGDWLRKPAGAPAELRGGVSRVPYGLIIHDSSLTLGSSVMALSGAVQEAPEPLLQLRLRSDALRLGAWKHMLYHRSFEGLDGIVGWDLVFESQPQRWNVRGKMNVAAGEFRHKDSGKRIDRVNAEISFLGSEARVENASFRFGSSQIKTAAVFPDLSEPKVRYDLWSAEVNPPDLPFHSASGATRLRDVRFVGEMQLGTATRSLIGTLSSSEGNLEKIPYHDLRADVAWSPKALSFNNLVLRALNGTLQSDGLWVDGGERNQRFEVTSEIASIDVNALLKQKFPQLNERIAGHLDLRGRFNGTANNGMAIHAAVSGSGEAAVQRGTIRDINLVAMLLPRHAGDAGTADTSTRLPATLAGLIERQDTPFDSLRANFTLEHERLRTDNLVLLTPDYTITGAGWVGFDRTMKWNGLFVLSPRLTQELQREYKSIRYLLDRRGRLAIPFSVEGKLSNVKIRPENRALAQALGSRTSANELERSMERETSKKDKSDWLPRSLEQLLNR
jgi:hypothetical protein